MIALFEKIFHMYTIFDLQNMLMRKDIRLVTLVITIFTVVAIWRIFEKAGIEGWKSLIPIYNLYLVTKLSMGNGWYFLLIWVPIIRWVFYCVLCVNLARRFGHGLMFALGLIFFNTPFILILGFESSYYRR